jgi:amino acid adenylation domain-containing protein
MNINYLDQIANSLKTRKEKASFFIKNQSYSYDDLSMNISKIRNELKKVIGATNILPESITIGVVTNDDIETYASLLAILLEGFTYVPLLEYQPIERSNEIIRQADIKVVLSSDGRPFDGTITINTADLEFENYILDYDIPSEKSFAYILFTSGSTGKPKGVPISHENLQAFIDDYSEIGYQVTENDRCLQTYELTFDLSVVSYIIPIISGACLYTIPSNVIKFTYIAEILEEQEITVIHMAASVIKYLRPYFNEIYLSKLKYCGLGAEAVPHDVTHEWSERCPNAVIDNLYGPTEDTIYCMHYRFNRNGKNKSRNGILSIGKSFTNGKTVILDENRNECPPNVNGELCLAGKQLTQGYWKNPQKNSEVFIEYKGERFYKTGDICFADEDGDIMYCGRLDSQVKVQGFRIELGEIEFHAKAFLKSANAVCVAYQNSDGNTEIALFIEKDKCDEQELKDIIQYLKNKIPSYMIPAQFICCPRFPLNTNDKTDKNILKTMIKL